jgi:hypothetical protein
MNEEQRYAIEWDCQKLSRQYYHLMDQRNYDDAVMLFLADVHWEIMGLDLRGRKAVRDAFSGLTDSTIRHVLTNTVVDVIDEDNATSVSYVTIYVEKGFPDDGPIPFEGPNRLGENHDRLVRTEEGWRIAHRTGQLPFARD